ncbi:DUF2878 domain-containing protein [Kaarinaea lacus]
MATRDNIINFILFQIGWFACVISSAASQPIWGVVVAAVVIGYHLIRAVIPLYEFYLIFIAMIIGVLWDSLLVTLSLLDYASGILIPNTAPYWIVVMWGLFATTLNVSLRWLKGKYQLSILLGAIAGPLAYYGGEQLGAVNFVDPSMAFLALAVGWAIFTPLLIAVSKNIDGYIGVESRARV